MAATYADSRARNCNWSACCTVARGKEPSTSPHGRHGSAGAVYLTGEIAKSRGETAKSAANKTEAQVQGTQQHHLKGASCTVEGCIVHAANPTHILLPPQAIYLGFTRNERDHKRPMEVDSQPELQLTLEGCELNESR